MDYEAILTIAGLVLKLLPGTSSVMNVVPVARSVLALLEQYKVLPGGQAVHQSIADLRAALQLHFEETELALSKAAGETLP